jgi:redox-sensitive bicupin YhaK (pirin superfamily)
MSTSVQAPTNLQKQLLGVYQPGSNHVVGDGFHVRNFFPSHELRAEVSPFLLLDYAGPTYYAPSLQPRGVGEHPHRGFETVTIVYQGAVEHRDSAGNAGTIRTGDVQWMTAASGIVHEEKHEKEFARRGGTLEAVQLWVNLPRAMKMGPPRYQTLLNGDIPVVSLEHGAGSLRVIAGEFQGHKGPAMTATPIQLYDLKLKAGRQIKLSFRSEWHASLCILHGQVMFNENQTAQAAELAVFGATGEQISIEAQQDATILVMSGEPIPEPIARYGPFVMNTQAELVEAMKDYQAGKMGHLHD